VFKTILYRGRKWGLALVLAGGCTLSAPAEPVIPIHTKNAALRLPVLIDERTRAELSEVKLFVRGPNGKWACAQTAPASQTAFNFETKEDGQYWFVFQTVDKRGRAEPANVEGVQQPHRAVMIDTTEPEVSAQPISLSGQRLLQCHVRDLNTDWASLRVVYTAPDGTMKPLSVNAADTPTVFKVPDPSVLEGKIRITVADRAGNRTTRDLDLGDPTARLGFNDKAAVEKGRPDPSLYPRDSEVTPPGMGKVVIPVEHRQNPMPPKPMLPDVPTLPEVPSDNIKAPVIAPPPEEKIPLKVPSGIPPIPDPILETPMNVVPPSDVSTVRKPNFDRDIPPIAPPKPMVDKPATSAATTHTILDTNVCTINYKLEGVVRASAKIDFWATNDSGRTWTKLRDESNGMPPAKLVLPGDGLYGIRIRPGGGAKPPEAGEEPDCEIEVDTTKPVVKMLQPTIGSGEDFGTAVLSWTATDKNLLSNSIRLMYATSPKGPWDVIVDGYKNDGLYRWAIPTGLTGPIYVRAEASDRAGNVGMHDLATPIEIETGKQRVKVIGITGGK
jgi:hypothetical protein